MFTKGQKVRCINNNISFDEPEHGTAPRLTLGAVYTVIKCKKREDNTMFVYLEELQGHPSYAALYIKRFEPAKISNEERIKEREAKCNSK
jgi:hypothetical protein